MMAAAHSNSKCGYCLNEEEGRVEPRRLKCGHEFCLGCLQAAKRDCQRSGVMMKCVFCSAAIQMCDIAALPAVGHISNKAQLNCDTCIRSNVQSEADFFCTDCKKKYCTNHNQVHNDLNGWDHTVLSIDDYQKSSAKLETRYCKVHVSSPLTMGCKVCKNICCNICTANFQHGQVCATGRAHEYDTLQALESLSLDGIKETTKQLVAKRNTLIEVLDKVMSDESKIQPRVKDITKQLETHRNAQISKINEEYKKQQDIVDRAAQEHRQKLEKKSEDIQKSIDRINDIITKYKTEVPNLHSVDIVAEEQKSFDIISSFPTLQEIFPLQFQLEHKASDVQYIQVKIKEETQAILFNGGFVGNNFGFVASNDARINSDYHPANIDGQQYQAQAAWAAWPAPQRMDPNFPFI